MPRRGEWDVLWKGVLRMTQASRNDSGLPRVLFLCTGNSCRSQMAEGFGRTLLAGRAEVESAGTQPHGLNPAMVEVMKEVGIDVRGQRSKHIDEFAGVKLDLVVTVCDSAHEQCPVMPGARVMHRGFDDPPRLAREAKSPEEALMHYRRVRDEIRVFIEQWQEWLPIKKTEQNKG